MVFFLTGVPGSGKSYYLVRYAESVKNKIDLKTNELVYYKIVHNISGYKNGVFVDFGETYLPKIVELNQYFLSVKKSVDKDQLLIKKAEELGLYHILLIVDECHLYFVNDYSDKGKQQYYALLWFISYHRHLFVDMVLATQNLSLVDYKFKAFAEYFVKAVPSSLRFSLFNKFKYIYYPDSKMWNDTKYKVEQIKPEKRIFDLYTSGDSVKKQKVFLPTLLIIAGLSVLVALLWYVFQRSFQHKPIVSVESNKTVSSSLPKKFRLNPKSGKSLNNRSSRSSLYSSDYFFDSVYCSGGFCYSYLTDNSSPIDLFNKLLSLSDVKITKTTYTYGVKKMYLNVSISKSRYLSYFYIPPASAVEDKSSHSGMIDDIKDKFINQL